MNNCSSQIVRPRRPAWSKGKLTGPKPPLRPGHVWAIRAKLQLEKRTRDLAMFNPAIDSKLRGCDLLALRVYDVAPNGYAIDRATVRQRKTYRPVRFELTELTRQALDDYLRTPRRKAGEYLFPGRRGPDRSLTTRQYTRRLGSGERHRPRPTEVCHALYEAHKGDPDLPPHREPAGGATASRAFVRKHSAISRR
jgi:integrase